MLADNRMEKTTSFNFVTFVYFYDINQTVDFENNLKLIKFEPMKMIKYSQLYIISDSFMFMYIYIYISTLYLKARLQHYRFISICLTQEATLRRQWLCVSAGSEDLDWPVVKPSWEAGSKKASHWRRRRAWPSKRLGSASEGRGRLTQPLMLNIDTAHVLIFGILLFSYFYVFSCVFYKENKADSEGLDYIYHTQLQKL